MKEWKRTIRALSREEIDKAVEDENWQAVRKGLKGLSTERKLEELEKYCRMFECKLTGALPRRQDIQVANYINSLLRGGLLVRRESRIVVQR